MAGIRLLLQEYMKEKNVIDKESAEMYLNPASFQAD